MLPTSPPIARGRTADVYTWKDGLVLKVFHEWMSRSSVEYEARLGRLVHQAGLPVPAVGKVLTLEGRNCIEYAFIEGRSMWEQLEQDSQRIFRFAIQLAELQVQLHAVSIEGLPSQHDRLASKLAESRHLGDDLRSAALAALRRLPDGGQLCHGDFHPGNVMIGPKGVFIIDWIDASAGDPLSDLARSTVIALGAAHVWSKGRALLIHTFHAIYRWRYFQLRPGGWKEYLAWLPVVAAARTSEDIEDQKVWLLRKAQGLL